MVGWRACIMYTDAHEHSIPLTPTSPSLSGMFICTENIHLLNINHVKMGNDLTLKMSASGSRNQKNVNFNYYLIHELVSAAMTPRRFVFLGGFFLRVWDFSFIY